MYFPALVTELRRLGRWFVYELFQLALWVAFALHSMGSLRSAFGGGSEALTGRRPGPAIRPRRSAEPRRGRDYSRAAA